MWNKKTVAVAAADSVDPQAWQAGFEAAFEQVAGRFARRDARAAARDLLAGLIAPVERKNCWTIAEHAGHETPHRLQHLLGRAVWDADGARDDVCAYAPGHLADPGAVLVVDETGDLKKGTKSVGVQRQYTGTAGRIENAQVAVFLTYAATGRWDSWHRWTTLAMLAHAFLTVLAVVMNDAESADDAVGLVAVTLGEARRLFATLAPLTTTHRPDLQL